MKLWQTLITLGFSLALVLTACVPPSTATPTLTSPPPTTDAKITQPTDGARIEQTETVKGTSQIVPNGSVIWIVVFLPTVGRYYPQNYPADVQANCDWSSVVYLGQAGESGLKADIIAVVADKNAQDAFNTYLKDARDKNAFPGLERIPEGATIYHRISVARK